MALGKGDKILEQALLSSWEGEEVDAQAVVNRVVLYCINSQGGKGDDTEGNSTHSHSQSSPKKEPLLAIEDSPQQVTLDPPRYDISFGAGQKLLSGKFKLIPLQGGSSLASFLH
jgi:hypothetical protein